MPPGFYGNSHLYKWRPDSPESRVWHDKREKIWEELLQEGDRAVGVIGAAMVDEAIVWAIKRRLRKDRETDRILDPSAGPLGSASARIRLAYVLGVVGQKHYGDLNIINDIRNKFAHNTLIDDNHHKPAKVTFKTQIIADWCKNLWLPKQSPKGGAKTPRDLYTVTVHYLAGMLWQEYWHREIDVIESAGLSD